MVCQKMESVAVRYLDVQLERYRAHGWEEAEHARVTAAKPAGDVLGVSDGDAESHDPDVAFDLRRYVAHARADDFQYGL